MKNAVVVKRCMIALAVLLMATTVFVRRASADTAWSAYQKCLDAAAVEANSCYQNAGDGYFANKKCDIIWDINNAACLNKLVGELK